MGEPRKRRNRAPRPTEEDLFWADYDFAAAIREPLAELAKLDQQDSAVQELLTPKANALPIPVMLTPIQQRWVFFGLGSGVLYMGLYGTGMFSV